MINVFNLEGKLCLFSMNFLFLCFKWKISWGPFEFQTISPNSKCIRLIVYFNLILIFFDSEIDKIAFICS